MSKKVLVIPDVHGSILWKSCIDRIDEFDNIVQLGDWFDAWENDWAKVDQIENLREFIELKKKYPQKVYALIGNHDLGYLMHENMSGHQTNKEIDIREALIEFAPFMDIACKIDKYVYSHAGFSKTWMKNNHFKTIEEVNASFHASVYEPFRFCGFDCYGDDVTQGPTWIRPRALCTDMYFKYQVVGHTEYKEGPIKFYNNYGELYCIDSSKHEHLFDMNDKVKKSIKAAMFSKGDKVEYIANNTEHKIRIIKDCALLYDEEEIYYRIKLTDQGNIEQVKESNVVRKIRYQINVKF